MRNLAAGALYANAARFLEQNVEMRLAVLRQLGLARYALFLAQMPRSEANIRCVIRFFAHPERVKFPDLKEADLAGLSLDGVNWIRGDLSGANLSGCSLVAADLLFARFVRANLEGADLRGATLDETVWTGAVVSGCQFGAGTGLTDRQHRELAAGGALFSA